MQIPLKINKVTFGTARHFLRGLVCKARCSTRKPGIAESGDARTAWGVPSRVRKQKGQVVLCISPRCWGLGTALYWTECHKVAGMGTCRCLNAFHFWGGDDPDGSEDEEGSACGERKGQKEEERGQGDHGREETLGLAQRTLTAPTHVEFLSLTIMLRGGAAKSVRSREVSHFPMDSEPITGRAEILTLAF